MEELQRHGEELHLPDAPRPELHVLGPGVAPEVDLALQPAERLHRGQVERAPPDEGSEGAEQLLAERHVPGHGAGLDQRRALPGAALLLVVLEHRRQGDDCRTGAPARTEVEVDAVAEPVLGGAGERPGQCLGEPGIEGDGGERAGTAATGGALAPVDVDQVDVGAPVEVVSSELAQAEDGESLRLRCAVALAQRRLERRQGGADQPLGQRRLLAPQCLHRHPQADVARGEPERSPGLVAPQPPEELAGVGSAAAQHPGHLPPLLLAVGPCVAGGAPVRPGEEPRTPLEHPLHRGAGRHQRDRQGLGARGPEQCLLDPERPLQREEGLVAGASGPGEGHAPGRAEACLQRLQRPGQPGLRRGE